MPSHGHRRTRRAARACCPACAASLPRRRGRRGRDRPSWAWVAVLTALAALIPLAARDQQAGLATAAAAETPAAPQREAPAPAPPAPRVIRGENAGSVIRWRDSEALGTPNAGSLVRGVRLPAEGRGFYTYDPASQTPPNAEWRRYGTDRLVREIIDLAAWWNRTQPDAPRLGIGDLSRENGGPFTGPVVGHASHQNGRDVDIRLPRRDGREGPANPASYDRELTQRIVDRLVARGAELVLIGPSLDLTGPAGTLVRWRNHDDHLHVRFPA